METSIQMELEQLEQQVQTVKKDIQDVGKKVDGTDKKVDSILFLLGGSEFDPTNGLITKFQSHEQRISKLEKLITRAQWTLVGMAIPASVGILELLRKIFIKQ